MDQKKTYPAINDFKYLAAILVVAIHTSPLATYSPEADFVLTRILARVAVPFFFMVTGYFVLPASRGSSRTALRYIKRIGCIYLASMLLYLPVGIYAGHFSGLSLPAVLKAIFLDGTFYHLWYLPALLLGFAFVVLLLRLPLWSAALISLLCYLIGLFGDSYYGFLPEGSLIASMYSGLFTVFEYTRNGLFYTPVFLILGYLLAKGKRPSCSASLAGVALSYCLMSAEGIFLRIADVQRHDSMYLFLLPLMYFLFSALLYSKKAVFSEKLPKELPLMIYLLHPLFIILVRGASKLLPFDSFVTNSLLHFLAVLISTFLGAWTILVLWKRFFPAGPNRNHRKRRISHAYPNQ